MSPYKNRQLLHISITGKEKLRLNNVLTTKMQMGKTYVSLDKKNKIHK